MATCQMQLYFFGDGPVVSRQEPEKDPTVLEPEEDTVENRGGEGVDVTEESVTDCSLSYRKPTSTELLQTWY